MSLAMIMTSLWRHSRDAGTYFGIYGKKRPLAILWYQLDVSGELIFKFIGGGNDPSPWEDVLQKGSVRRELRLEKWVVCKWNTWD